MEVSIRESFLLLAVLTTIQKGRPSSSSKTRTCSPKPNMKRFIARSGSTLLQSWAASIARDPNLILITNRIIPLLTTPREAAQLHAHPRTRVPAMVLAPTTIITTTTTTTTSFTKSAKLLSKSARRAHHPRLHRLRHHRANSTKSARQLSKRHQEVPPTLTTITTIVIVVHLSSKNATTAPIVVSKMRFGVSKLSGVLYVSNVMRTRRETKLFACVRMTIN